MYTARRAGIAGYGYHRRRLRINQESRGSKNRSSMCVKSGKHNLVSSSVHRNLLILILVSFIPLLLIQGTIQIDLFCKLLNSLKYKSLILILIRYNTNLILGFGEPLCLGRLSYWLYNVAHLIQVR